MNYVKWGLYALIITFSFYVLMEMQAFNGSLFASSFFTGIGFIATFLFILAELLFAIYALEFGRKKEAGQKS